MKSLNQRLNEEFNNKEIEESKDDFDQKVLDGIQKLIKGGDIKDARKKFGRFLDDSLPDYIEGRKIYKYVDGLSDTEIKKIGDQSYEEIRKGFFAVNEEIEEIVDENYSTDKDAFAEQVARARSAYDNAKDAKAKQKAKEFLDGAKLHDKKMASKWK